jgi:arsenite-transporting ATPase
VVRTVVVTGSAGSGTSTVARAVAAQAGADGARVALLVGDPAQASADAGSAAVIEVDPLGWGQQALRQSVALRQFAGQPWSGFSATDVLPVPGLDALAWWGTLREVRRGRYDTVVVDAGPIESALSWLTLPDTVVGALRRAWPLPQRAAAAANGLAGGSWHLRAMERLDSEADELATILRSPATAGHLVTRPREHELGRLLRQLAALALFELPVTDLVLNDFSARRDYDRAVAQRLQESLPHLQIRQARARRSPPSASALAREIYPHGLEPGKSMRPRIRREGEAYQWSWTLPFADPSRVWATVSGEDAILTVARARRVVALPSVLRRCQLADATMESGVLQLRFVPDPGLWPATWEVS